MRGAICRTTGEEKVEIVDDLAVADPGPGQVKVHVHAAGICHSDLSGMNGNLPQGAPFVPGHEGAGEVVAVGDGVTSTKVGDHVIVAWTPPCGRCKACLRGQPNLCVDIFFAIAGAAHFTSGGSDIFGFAGTGTWAEEMILPEQGVVVIPDDVPYEIGALIGCGVTTGVGAAVNTAQVEVGSSVVVFGCGGVGISAIQGARLCGAAEIVAVDTVPEKLEDAKRFGATHGVHPDNLAEVSAEVTGGEGFDYAFECIGIAPTFRAAWDATRRGGTTVIVGAGRGRRGARAQRVRALLLREAAARQLLRRSRRADRVPPAHPSVEGGPTRPRRHGEPALRARGHQRGHRGPQEGEVIRQIVNLSEVTAPAS